VRRTAALPSKLGDVPAPYLLLKKYPPPPPNKRTKITIITMVSVDIFGFPGWGLFEAQSIQTKWLANDIEW
jgi:hypothetical protein